MLEIWESMSGFTYVKFSEENKILHSTILTNFDSKMLVLEMEALKEILSMLQHGEPKKNKYFSFSVQMTNLLIPNIFFAYYTIPVISYMLTA